MIEALKKIMVVDDETIQRNGLQKMIQKVAPNTIVWTCSNGCIALDNIRQNPPQLLITDIKMPVMDGMQLIQRVAEEFPLVKIVLISAYSEFSFAKTAIQCQALDYLIKPYRKEVLEKLLERIEAQIVSENERERQLADFHQYSSEMERQMEEKRLRSLLFGQGTADGLQEYAGFSVIISLRFRCRKLSCPDQLTEITKRQQGLILSKVLTLFPGSKLLTLAMPLQMDSEKMIVFASVEHTQMANALLNQLSQQLKSDNIFLWAGVSHIQPGIAECSGEAYQQAEDMLAFGFYHENGSIYCFEQHEALLHTPAFPTVQFEKEIAATWRSIDNTALHECLMQYQEKLEQDPKIYPRKVKHRVSSIIMNLIKEIQGLVSAEDYDALLNQAYMEYGSCEFIGELFMITEQLLMNTNGFFQLTQNQYDAVEMSIQYIKTHLEEDLSLQKVAKQMHFHPNYLSGQIKNKLGMSYTNFLVQLRMELAGELLRQTDLKIQEIAKKCGFKESSYFNRVFRKEHNISPEQYRKVHKQW